MRGQDAGPQNHLRAAVLCHFAPYGGTRAQVDRLRLASFLQQAECRQIPGRIHREPIAQGTARDAVIGIAQVMDRLATLI